MDLWVVATAAGAGYLAKYWQHISRDKEGSSGSTSEKTFPDEPQSPSLIDRIRDKTCPIKKLSRIREEGDHSGDILSETLRRDGLIGTDASSCSVLNHELDVGIRDNGSFSREFRNEKKFQLYGGGYGILDADMSSIPEDSTWKTEAASEKSPRRSRLHLQSVKLRNALDSCLMAQMHRERAELEEYLLTPLSSPCTPSLRPFLVSDGKRIISRASGDFMGRLHTNIHRKADSDVVGVPHLPKINASDCSKQKFNHKKRMGRLRCSSNVMQFDTQAGFSSGQAVFCLGISVGILSTIISNKVELENLKVNLKQSEHLVEDLQEELEMKDSLTVKELVSNDYSQDIHEISSINEKMVVVSNQEDMDVLLRYADEESVCQKKDESMSNIEAELEAELQRLEMSMKGSTLSSELNQGFDEDIIAELVQGELQADTVRRRSSSEPTIDRGSNSTSTLTPHSAKDCVSPRELSLRLHEVIQSRLESRIIELETELAKNQNHIKHLLSEKSNYWRDFPNSGSSSSRCSPREPLVMNLSGDALDAYNEAFDELNKVTEKEDEPSEIRGDGHRQSEDERNMWLAGKREEAVPISITGIPSSEDSPMYSDDGDDGEDDDMLLIMQIIEKARQGSPAILKAQKAMVSLNINY
ncbi:hypothetical protein RND81_02G039300 [Saponaria officinalis]|uniref:Uncharacterized protein n=1 Tax=Saponaria officinalis TaxID=3572 RepID=A0AAW1MML6_SAPOF